MTNSNKGTESENLSRIKDILFGEDLQSIEQKFELFKSENSLVQDKIKNEIVDRLAKIELSIETKSKEVDKIQEKNIEIQKDINSEFKEEIVKITIDVKNEKEKLEDNLKEKIDELSHKISSLKDSLNIALEELNKNHTDKLNELNSNKVSKVDIADMFIELADKLKK